MLGSGWIAPPIFVPPWVNRATLVPLPRHWLVPRDHKGAPSLRYEEAYYSHAPSGSILRVWFSFDGRIDRRAYWLRGILPFFAVLAGLSILLMLTVGTGTGLVWLVGIWGKLAISTKRWHDLERSGWLSLLNLVPFLGLVLMVYPLGTKPAPIGLDNMEPATRRRRLSVPRPPVKPLAEPPYAPPVEPSDGTRWHAPQSLVYHISPSCSVGGRIPTGDLLGGDGGKLLCLECQDGKPRM